MNKNTHYFYALRLPMEAKLKLKEQCDIFKQHLHFGKWVHHEDFHITLAFLGNADKQQLERSAEYVKQALAHVSPFSLAVNSLGVFGKQESPRIFWAGAAKEDKLHELRKFVFEACSQAQFQLETRPFSPHITLARKWKGEHELTKEKLAACDPFEANPIHFAAAEVVLYQTHLDREPKYEAIKVFPFSEADPADSL